MTLNPKLKERNERTTWQIAATTPHIHRTMIECAGNSKSTGATKRVRRMRGLYRHKVGCASRVPTNWWKGSKGDLLQSSRRHLESHGEPTPILKTRVQASKNENKTTRKPKFRSGIVGEGEWIPGAPRLQRILHIDGLKLDFVQTGEWRRACRLRCRVAD